ncbi:C40 family peptidase [Sporolactobacillus laevolacticus]|uniref:Hydrolase n=1 Tax=Sporolactobacillus laevolacticus DSM 442 TaxID=1395513 RepID=V6IXF7_9BACL|nr:C40 family peptidase [Sporolactobacillus laevolacticus]EST11331.1 hydrolase [Sporolactobacillus laevolacticus DSM 442]
MKRTLLSVTLIGGLALTSLGTHQAHAASSVSAVDLAEQGIGKAYSWGQNDCSGFTMRVFSHFGIQLPHSAAAQAGYGMAINRSDLQPGDLVFFNTSGSGISHVGIYVGNNRMISAETAKIGVRETQIFGGGASSYWEPRYVTARRIVTSNQAQQSSSAPQTQSQTSTPSPQASSTQTDSSQSSSVSQTNNSGSTTRISAASQQGSEPSGRTGTQNASGVYIVQAGDTLWSISNHHGLSVQKIEQLNQLNDSMIYPGQKIYVQEVSENYTIKSGDSLWSIAKIYGTTVEQLMKINHLSSDRIYPDQGLALPEK